MSDLLILYYALCHTIGVAAIVAALISSRLLPGKGDLRFVAVAGSLSLILLPFSIFAYLESRLDVPPAFNLLMWILSLSGEALMISALPRFVHSFFSSPREKAVLRAWDLIAVASVAAVLPSLVWAEAWILVYVPMVAMPAAIVYAVAVSRARGLAAAKGGERPADSGDERWRSLLRTISIVTAIAFPALLAVDFFPGIAAGLGLRLSGYVKVFPLFYAVLCSAYLARTIPALAQVAEAAEAPPAGPGAGDGSAYGLSARELEVARLLLSGLTYREIAERLFISMSTVKTHVERIYRKAGTKNKIQLGMRLRGGEAGRPE